MYKDKDLQRPDGIEIAIKLLTRMHLTGQAYLLTIA